MDSNGMMSLHSQKKDVPITEGGIRITRTEDEIQRSKTVPGMGGPFELPEQPVQEEKKEKKETVDQKNRRLSKVGEAFLGGIDEKEIELDFDEENLIKLDRDLSRISDVSERSLHAGENRLQRLGYIPQTASKDSVKATESLRVVGNKVIKNGRFSDDALRAGLEFMKKVDKWAGKPDNPSEKERDFYGSFGSSDSISFLYVDGKPIKEFVEQQYGYRGSEDRAREKAVLSAYAALITNRLNHAITLVRPTYINGHADVDIRNLSVNMSDMAKSRSAKVKVIGNSLKGEEYRRYCESAYRSEMHAKSAKAARIAEKKGNIESIDKLTALMDQLKAAGKGSHQNYDDFVWAFQQYYNAVTALSSNPADMKINRVTLESLDNLNHIASNAAMAYLKGKKMNLPRHKAVENIRSFLGAQSGQFGKHLKELAKDKTGKKTLDLSTVLAEEDAGFVVIGIEEEIQGLKQNAENNENDLNQYTTLDSDAGLSVRTKQLLRLKNEINSDKASRTAREALYNSLTDPNATDQVIIDYARVFLMTASSALWKNEKHVRDMKQRYPYAADNTNMMLAIIARTQLSQIYRDEFQKVPALQTAMEMWNEEISSEEAKAMTYQSNFVGNRISKKEFDENGGSAHKRYVTRMEGNEIVSATHGFLAFKAVKGRPDIVQLVPSMPEFATLSKGQPAEKQIPLRKTMKTMFKALTRLVIGEDGHVKAQPDQFKDQNITAWIDQMLRLAASDTGAIDDAGEFIYEIVHPEMTRMLEEEYRQKRVRGYKTKAYNDALDFCNNYIDLIKGSLGGFVTSAPDVSFNSFVYTVNFVNGVTTEDIMGFKKFGDYKIDGRPLTAEEVSEALESFKEEMRENEAEFAGFRNIDTDDVEMPSISSCNDNAQINEVAMVSFVNNEEVHARLNYDLKNFAKTHPNEAIDAMMANLDNIIASKYGKESTIKEERKKILELDEKRKKGKLGKADLDTLKELYPTYAKYDWHRGANLGKVGNAQYTTETMAPLPDELIKSPFTSKILIGKYVSDKPMGTDEDTGMKKHDAMNRFYDHDDAFKHCKDHKQVVKIAVKDIIRQMVDKLM